jgi:hypothetical protein
MISAALSAYRMSLRETAIEQGKLALCHSPDDKRLQENLAWYLGKKSGTCDAGISDLYKCRRSGLLSWHMAGSQKSYGMPSIGFKKTFTKLKVALPTQYVREG